MQGYQLHTGCILKHLVLYQTSIKEKRKATTINFADADEFALTFHDFFGSLSEKTYSSTKDENVTN